MSGEQHPFHAIAAKAASQGLPDLKLTVEDGGAYVRLHNANPPLFFKHRNDPSDPRDRQHFDAHKRILLSAEDCDQDPKAICALIKTLLVQFADYERH